MNLIQFIFALVQNFVPITPKDYATMYNQAKTWYMGIEHYDNEHPDPSHNWKNQFKHYAETWYVKLLVAVLYLFVFRWLSMWMAGNRNVDNKPSDENEF